MTQDLSRYIRQTAVSFIGEDGQRRIRAASVLQVGCGALGTVQAELLVRAGVGNLTIVDRDVVELSNLQRQIGFDEEDARLSRPKAQAAAARLSRVNSEVNITPVVAHLTAASIGRYLENVDLVMDATDNFDTRYLINDACVKAGIPWIYGGVLGVEGTVMPIVPGKTPCFCCLMPNPPEASRLPTIVETGVLSTTVMVTAAEQVTLALGLLSGKDNWTPGVRTIDVWNGSIRTIPLSPNPNCPCCGRREFRFLEQASFAPSVLWARQAVMFQLAGSPEAVARRAAVLMQAGGVHPNDMVWEATFHGRKITLFSDGRVFVSQTRDETEARKTLEALFGNLEDTDA